MKYYYVYLTTNLVNNKKYIGQHYGAIDDYYLGSGTILKRAIERYGRDNFNKEILEICSNRDELNKAEQKWIKQLNAIQDQNYYNIAEGGHGNNCMGLTLEQEQQRRRKISEGLRGEKNYYYNVHRYGKDSPHWGHHHSEETKKILSAQKSGGNNPKARRVGIYDKDTGKLIQTFDTQRDLKIFLGLSPNGSTDTLKKYIREGKVYHGYIVKYI